MMGNGKSGDDGGGEVMLMVMVKVMVMVMLMCDDDVRCMLYAFMF
jgi:hypothetical protein